MEPDAVLRTTVTLETDAGLSFTIAESVVIGEKIWLVTEWETTPDGQWRTPARAIRVDLLRYQRMMEQGFGELLLQDSIPIEVAARHQPSARGLTYELARNLPVRVPVLRAS